MNSFIQKLSSLWSTTESQRGKTYYFAHIPKTAGTSFIVLLDRFFPQDVIFPQQLWRDVGDINVKKNERYQLIRGHFGGGGGGELTNQSLAYLTLLRDPFAMSVSTYQFVKREQNTLVHDLVNQSEFDLDAFLTHPKTSQLVNNRMVRNLSFDFVEDPSAQEVFLSSQTIEYLKPKIAKAKRPLTPEQRYYRAKQFIDRCFWFGLVESFDRSMDLLCHALKKPALGISQKLNVRKDPVELSEKARRRIEILNAWDIKLYRYATRVFESRYEAMLNDLDSYKSHNSQDLNELLDKQYQQNQRQLVHQPEVRLTFDQAIIGQQWHRRELMYPEHEYFRWTGPQEDAWLDMWIKPVDGQLSLRIINAISEQILDDLQLSINGQRVQWQSDDTGVVRVIKVEIAATLIRPNGLMRVGIHLSNTQSHQTAFGSDDERLVGVAVHWLKFST